MSAILEIRGDRDGLLEYLASRVLVGDGCWEWQGGKTTEGYGQVMGLDRKRVYAHRLMYELMVNDIPEGLHIDHLCKNTSCVRPAHLEPVLPAENLRRSTAIEGWKRRCAELEACKNGHPWTPETTYVTKANKRACRICARASWKRMRARRKQGTD